MRILITGGAGFVGSHVVEHFLRNTDVELCIFDRLTYAANGLHRLRDINAFAQYSNRLNFFAVDITSPISSGMEREVGQIDYILHMAAETHVDNSITDPRPFVISNVIGTMEMLEFARKLPRLQKFLYMSTDEVFGPAGKDVHFKEWDRYNSTNPYSASKAAGEELCLAWANTYKIPVAITHTMNAFGERQHPEKFIPKVVRKILREELISVHANPARTAAGSRSYIHCRNIAAGIQYVLMLSNRDITGSPLRDKYNIVGEQEVDNLTLVKLIHKNMEEVMNRKYELKYELVDFHSSRPGHDLRYSLSGERLKKLGWTPPQTFEESLAKCVQWMVSPQHLDWLLID